MFKEIKGKLEALSREQDTTEDTAWVCETTKQHLGMDKLIENYKPSDCVRHGERADRAVSTLKRKANHMG